MFGKCFLKFSGSSPLQMAGTAVVDAHVKVVVRHVRLETRVVKQDLVTQHLIRGHLGETQSHLVFNFNINVDGTVNKFDVHKLKLTGCAVQLLGRFICPNCDF